jgi:hypothetical protein
MGLRNVGFQAMGLGFFVTSLALSDTPVVTHGTYFGGSGDFNRSSAVAVAPSGEVVIAGTTNSQTLPGTERAFQRTKATGFANNRDIFIAKFDSTGRTLIWATFLGGDADDGVGSIAVDSSGNIYVTGGTSSSNFPASAYVSCPFVLPSQQPLQPKCSMTSTQPMGTFSSFVAKIN